jgi:hypothetical protein
MRIPLQTRFGTFETLNERSSKISCLNKVYCSNDLYVFAVLLARCAYRVRLGRLSGGVPAIVFGYPRHSGATDEGMTSGPLIFAYLVFGPERVSFERLLRPIEAAV